MIVERSTGWAGSEISNMRTSPLIVSRALTSSRPSLLTQVECDLSPRKNPYRHARIHPRPPMGPGFKVRFPGGPPVRYASAVLDTMLGRYEASWELTADRFRLKATVPPNCRATIVLPDGDVRHVVSGRHEFSLVVGEAEDTGLAVLPTFSQAAS